MPGHLITSIINALVLERVIAPANRQSPIAAWAGVVGPLARGVSGLGRRGALVLCGPDLLGVLQSGVSAASRSNMSMSELSSPCTGSGNGEQDDHEESVGRDDQPAASAP